VLEYFQLADDAERRSGLELLHTFVMVLDVFSDFLATEQCLAA
jgi:hypothetical protein